MSGWSKVKEHTSEIMYRLTQMKFELPKDGKEKIEEKMEKLNKDLHEAFRTLQD